MSLPPFKTSFTIHEVHRCANGLQDFQSRIDEFGASSIPSDECYSSVQELSPRNENRAQLRIVSSSFAFVPNSVLNRIRAER
jgi:hypothetical protein